MTDESSLGDRVRRAALDAYACQLRAYANQPEVTTWRELTAAGPDPVHRHIHKTITATIAPLQAALAAVRDLEPPPIHDGDDEELHAILTDGWTTCHATAMRAIETALESAQ